MRQKWSKLTGSRVLSAILLLAVILVVAIFANRRHSQKTTPQEEPITKEELWQQYNPNEDELWHIVSTKNHIPRKLRYLGAHTLIKKTSSEKRLTYLLDYKHEKVSVEASDKLFQQNLSIETLKKIIEKVPERAEVAVSILVRQVSEPNTIGCDCFLNIILNAPFYRKWAWKNILSNPDWITEDIQWCFAVDPNFPDEAVDIYFGFSLQPENYRWVINSAVRREHKLRAWTEFKLTKPGNEEVVKILSWVVAYPPKIVILAGKYILDNNPSEEDIIWVEESCPSLKKDCQEGRKDLLEREKEKSKTKEEILEELKVLYY